MNFGVVNKPRLIVNASHNTEKSITFRYKDPSFKKIIDNKIDNINKLNRTLLMHQIKINECVIQTETCTIEERMENEKQLKSLHKLKKIWEKELMAMYFEE